MTAATAPRVAAPLSAPGAGFASVNPGLAGTGPMLLSGLHFAAAMLFLLAGAAGVVWVAPDLAAGRFLEPRVAGVTHLFTLGWLTTTILGALYQLLPVALGTPLRSIVAGHAGLALLVPGVAMFALGVATNDDPLRHAGIALVVPALLLAIANVGVSLARATRRDVTWWAVAVALAALFVTLLLGALLVHNVKTGVLAGARVRVLAVHLHIALCGWAFAVLIGMSQRLLPMFLLAHGVDETWSRRALVLLVGGLTALTTGLVTDRAPLAWIGALLLAGAVGALLVQAGRFHRVRVRRRLDAGMRIAATGLAFSGAAVALGLVTLATGTAAPRIATAYGIVAVLGVMMLYVVGHFYKIVPFLAWIARFRGRMGREEVPTIADLYSARVATVQWIVMTMAVLILTAGTLVGHGHCTRVGAVLLVVGVLLFASQIIRVAFPMTWRSS